MFANLPRPLLFAHRGASAHAPENTLEAFDLAARLGAHVLELDVHLSADGEVVVIHDATVERTTNGQGKVCEQTYAHLSQLDAGYRFCSNDGTYRFRDRGLHIPTLKEVLAAFPSMGFNIEIKQLEPSMVQQTLNVLKDRNPEQVLLTAGDDRIMRNLEEANPRAALGLSFGQAKAALLAAWTARAVPKNLHYRALQIPPAIKGIPTITRKVLQRLHRVGIEVHLWTINDVKQAEKWLHRGVDGIMSDDAPQMAALFTR